MTDPHPLTDEMIDEITDELSIFSENMMAFLVKDCMRAAYTKGSADMLEQAIEWLNDNAGMLILSIETEMSTRYLESLEDEFIQDFKQAMRPTD